MLTLIKSSFIDYKLTILRNKKTPNSLIRQTMNEISYLIASEVFKYFKFKKISVQTPVKKTTGKNISQSIVIVPILRAGLGLVEGFVKLLPDAEKGHIGLYRDDLAAGHSPSLKASQIPELTNKRVVIVDDVLFTGRTIRAAMDAIIDFGRPQVIQLAVVVDRGHRELPIKPDYVGKNIPTSVDQTVRVALTEIDTFDAVELKDDTG